MNDSFKLFDDSPAPQRLPMIDADVTFIRGFYTRPLSTQYLGKLHAEIAWRQEVIKLWGKEHLQPRLTAWHGDLGNSYAYSGIVLQPSPWTPTLLRIKEDIENATGHRFNSVLANLYRDEHDSVGWHSDAEPELGTMPVIASLSLGETRTFKLRHKDRKDRKPVSIELTDGILLVMAGTTQQFWQHTVPKERGVRDIRINLTFRTIFCAGP